MLRRRVQQLSEGSWGLRPDRMHMQQAVERERRGASRRHRKDTCRRRWAKCCCVSSSRAERSEEERRRVAIFVEPSPFSHVSGMKNRFLRLIEDLAHTGDDVRPFPRRSSPSRAVCCSPSSSKRSFSYLQVLVITPDRNPPEQYNGARVRLYTSGKVLHAPRCSHPNAAPLLAGHESNRRPPPLLLHAHSPPLPRCQPTRR